MSQINVNTITGKDGGSAVNFPHGITVTGVVTATTLNQNVVGVVTATTFDGNLTGNVTGNVNGNVTGNLTGNVTGNASGSAGSLAAGATGSDLTLSGNLTVQGTQTTIDSATLSVEDKNIGIGSVTTPTNTTANGGGLTLFGGADGDKEFKWIDSSGVDYWSLTGGYLYSGEGLNTRKMLAEGVKILGNDLGSVPTIDVSDGMVHYRTANLGTDIRPNIRYSSTRTLDNTMNTGEAITVTIIHAVNNTAHNVSGLEIDGTIVTVNWIGGSAPSDGGGSGVDIYTFNIIKTAANTYTVIGNQTKTS